MARPETVVNYDAWNQGYMPPSEHILIDQLAYRGARVAAMTDWGEAGAVWVVVRGDVVTKKMRDTMHQLTACFMDETTPPIPADSQSEEVK